VIRRRLSHSPTSLTYIPTDTKRGCRTKNSRRCGATRAGINRLAPPPFYFPPRGLRLRFPMTSDGDASH
jgi:hypothetical protein